MGGSAGVAGVGTGIKMVHIISRTMNVTVGDNQHPTRKPDTTTHTLCMQ